MQLKDKTFLVYGAGKSGISAYDFLISHGAMVYIYSDDNVSLDKSFNQIYDFKEVLKIKFDYAVLSPGVQIVDNDNINKLKNNNVLLICELELGYLFCKGKFIAVTGTNGKTSCVSLLGHILESKFDTFVCGNIGTPITSICDQTTENSVVICEVSSFMLELVSANFAPDISVILNVSSDHISRHKTFEEYKKAKLNITKYQSFDDYLFVDYENESILTNAMKNVVFNEIKFKSKLIGDFNNHNINFCYRICKVLGICDKQFKKLLKSFEPLQFRLQKFTVKKGVIFINDSKSTNPDSTIKALSAMKKPVIVLLGGSDKGNSFEQIFENSKKIKFAIFYGSTANKLKDDANFKGFNNFVVCQNLEHAIKESLKRARKKDIVLFSPACASFDEFKNYIERGKFFNNYIKESKF